MRKLLTKLSSMLVAIAMVIGMMPATAMAAVRFYYVTEYGTYEGSSYKVLSYDTVLTNLEAESSVDTSGFLGWNDTENAEYANYVEGITYTGVSGLNVYPVFATQQSFDGYRVVGYSGTTTTYKNACYPRYDVFCSVVQNSDGTYEVKNTYTMLEKVMTSATNSKFTWSITLPDYTEIFDLAEGAEVSGWYTSSDCTGDTVTSYSSTLAAGLNVVNYYYAVVEEPSYTITYKVGDETYYTETGAVGETYTLIDLDESSIPEGYDFLGWSDDPNATYSNNVVGNSYTFEENVTLYAVFYEQLDCDIELGKDTYSNQNYRTYCYVIYITYHENDPTTDEDETYTIKRIHESKYLGVNRYTSYYNSEEKEVGQWNCGFTAPDGYDFNSWNTEADGSGTSYAEHTSKFFSPGVNDLYAIYDKQSTDYTITYTVDGTVTATDTVTEGESFTMSQEASKEGYDFLGWTDTEGTVYANYIVGNTYTPSEDLTLYAVFTYAEDYNYYQAVNSSSTTSAYTFVLYETYHKNDPTSEEDETYVVKYLYKANSLTVAHMTCYYSSDSYTGKLNCNFTEPDGYEFTGYWNTAADGGGTSYAEHYGGSFSAADSIEIELYATYNKLDDEDGGNDEDTNGNGDGDDEGDEEETTVNIEIVVAGSDNISVTVYTNADGEQVFTISTASVQSRISALAESGYSLLGYTTVDGGTTVTIELDKEYSVSALSSSSNAEDESGTVTYYLYEVVEEISAGEPDDNEAPFGQDGFGEDENPEDSRDPEGESGDPEDDGRKDDNQPGEGENNELKDSIPEINLDLNDRRMEIGGIVYYFEEDDEEEESSGGTIGSGALALVNVDAETGAYLDGATYALFRSSNNDLVGVYTADERGWISTFALSYDTYYFVQVEAAEGYVLDQTPIYVTLTKTLSYSPEYPWVIKAESAAADATAVVGTEDAEITEAEETEE